MEEEFILVSKKKISEYESKIKQLQEELVQKNTPNYSLDDIEHIILKSQQKVLSQLEQTNQITQSAIDEKIKQRINQEAKKTINQENDESLTLLQEKMSSNHKQLLHQNEQIISNLKLLVEHLQDTAHLDEILECVKDIKRNIPQLSSNGLHTTSNSLADPSVVNQQREISLLEMYEKLQEIELFMSNLRILLSYVQPRDLVRN